MTDAEFTKFFFIVLDERIPNEARDIIRGRWKRLNLEPHLSLNDQQIKDHFGADIEIAAVAGTFCLYRFAFREFVVQNAPEHVAQTIIQHEIIHCYLDAIEADQKLMKQLLRPPVFNPPRTMMDKVFASIRESEQRVISYAVEEIRVAGINKDWGVSDEVARKWVQQYRKAKNDVTTGTATDSGS